MPVRTLPSSLGATLAGVLALTAPVRSVAQPAGPAPVACPAAGAVPFPLAGRRLGETYRDRFLLGVALNARQISGVRPDETALIASQFTAISPENALKWAQVHPRPGVYDFTLADRYVAFGRAHGQAVIGHTLVWHNQTPAWVFQDDRGRPLRADPAGRALLLARMREHINTVVGRYRGRVLGWDVVNEALDDQGRLRDSPWRRIIGDDYIALAYRYAHEADPGAELYYNDYNLEMPAKRAGAIALLSRLRRDGVPVTAVGLQGHDTLDFPTATQEMVTIRAFADLGLEVNITELDIDVLPRVNGPTADVRLSVDARPDLNPYAAGLPVDAGRALARRYAQLFGVFQAFPGVVRRVTLWGLGDGDSWLNDWPVRGRASYPLLFDRQDRPKAAFTAVLAAHQPACHPRHEGP